MKRKNKKSILNSQTVAKMITSPEIPQKQMSIDDILRYHNLKEKVCSNPECIQLQPPSKFNLHEKFCCFCGQELTEKLKNVYIELYDCNYEEDYSQATISSANVPAHIDTNKPKVKERISIKEFIKILKAYEKELFIESI